MEPVRCMAYVGKDYVEVQVLQFVVKDNTTYGVCSYKQQLIELELNELTVIQFPRY